MSTAIQAGQRLTAARLNAAANAGVSSVEVNSSTAGTTTSTTYTATLTTAGVLGTSFVAPPTGRVLLLFAAGSVHSAANGSCNTSVAVRTGSTVGSGSTVAAANDNWRIFQQGSAGNSDASGGGASRLVTGLTAGSTYNAVLEHSVTAGTGTFVSRVLQVIPAP